MTENPRLHLTDEEIEVGMEVWVLWGLPTRAVVTEKKKSGFFISSDGETQSTWPSRHLYRTKIDLLKAQVQRRRLNISIEEGFLADAERRLAEEENHDTNE